MSQRSTNRFDRYRVPALWRRAAMVVVIVCAGITAVPAQDDSEGGFTVRSAESELVSGVYLVNATIDLRLSREARAALESGVPLTVHIEIDLIRVRRFWIDDEEADVEQRFELAYHALTERYIVRNLNSGDQTSFATVMAALNYLGRIERLPFIDVALLASGRAYDARIKAELDVDEFSGPLRLLTFWRRDFSLESEWYRWRLRDG
ncbi:MAG: DUF4390 domain-containing protein [Gammaproteobacteria bacterium]